MALTKKAVKNIEAGVKHQKYLEAVGRRKTAIARVRFIPHDTKKIEMVVNGKAFTEYFSLLKLQERAVAPSVATEVYGEVSVRVAGGGIGAQADAVRLGFARAIIKGKPELRSKLKQLGFLKRDPRMVERKKSGLRKARRPQQWRKR